MSAKEPMFPILNDPIIRAVPWAFMAPHEAQAQINHGQSLNTLARRGGLDCLEAEATVLGKKIRWGTSIKAGELSRSPANLLKLVLLFERERDAALRPLPRQEEGGNK